MKRRILISFLLIILGVVVFWLTKSPNTSVIQKDEIIHLETVVGKATLKNSQDEITMLTTQSKVFENDTLSTDQDATITFQLASGAKFEVAPLTKLIFENDSNHQVNMTILEGQVQLLSQGKGSFDVTKKGKSLSLAELKTSIETPKQTETPQIETAPVKPTTQRKTSHDTTTLDQEEINKVMRNQTSFLHRCYINYMLRTQRLDLSGKVVLSFTIQPTGKVTNAKVISSPIQDDQLDRCLNDVISRATFQEFTSQPILVQAYPIHLD